MTRSLVVPGRRPAVRDVVLATARDGSAPRLGPAFERSAVGMALLTPDGRWLDANLALCELLGYERAELLARSWQDLTPPEDVPEQASLADALAAREIDHFRRLKRYLRRDGDLVWAEVSVMALRDELGAPYNLAQIVDVTDRERAYMSLADAEERTRLLLEHSTDVAFRTSQEGILEWLSPAVERVLRYRCEEMVGRPTLEFIHPDDRKEFTAAARSVGAGGDASYRARFRIKDGGWRWLWVVAVPVSDGGGRVVGRTGIARDVDELVRAQEALAGAETAAHVGHWTWVPSAGAEAGVSTWSPEAYRILGLDPAGPALELEQLADLLTPDSLERSAAAIATALVDGLPYTLEIEFDRPDGTHGWAEIRGAPEELDGGRRLFVGLLVDVTERKAAERALLERESELAEAQRVGQTGSFRWEPATDQRTWSTEMYRLYGRESGSRVPTRDESASQMQPEGFATLNAAVADALRTGRPYQVEYDLRGLDGIERRVLARGEVETSPNGAISAVRGTLTDITELAAARAALAASEARARQTAREAMDTAMELAIAEHELEEAQRLAGVGSWRMDLRTGQRTWSEQLLRIHGLPSGTPPPTREEQAAFAAEEDLRRHDALTERCATTGEPFDLEFDLLRADGTRRRVISHAEAVRDDAGAIVGLRGTMTDISIVHERRELQARRVAARADYLDRAEHTMRTHLTVVEGWAEAIGETADSMDPDTLRRAAAAIARNAGALTRLMHALMVEAGESARAEALQPVRVDAAAVAGRVVDEFRGRTHLRSLTVTPDHGVFAMGTEDAIATVVGHLVENAAKFSGDDGSVAVEVGRARRGGVQLVVTDDGPGIPEGLRPFDAFSRSGPKAGNGLGLHVVKTLVEAMGGEIHLEARPDGRPGARFVVTLRGRAA